MTTGNNQKKPETRGRKKNEKPSVSVHCRVPDDLYQLLQYEILRQEKQTGMKPAVSTVLMQMAKKSLPLFTING